jgi:Zn finger protein HypA/HybF involved in hydrogenase expression
MLNRKTTVVAATSLSLLLVLVAVSCNQPAARTAAPPQPVNTMWSATTVPTTQIARQLGFTFAPAPAGASGTGRATDAEVKAFSKSCLACHNQTDSHTMHETAVSLACVDCHGGRHDIDVPANMAANDPRRRTLMLAAHVSPRN